MKKTTARKPPCLSKEDLLKSQSDAQERATRLAWFVRELAPAEGFSFLASPRGLQELLVFVDVVKAPQFSDDERVTRGRVGNVVKSDVPVDGSHLESLLEALKDARDYRAKWRTGSL